MFFLVATFVFFGQLGLNLGIPFPSEAACQYALENTYSGSNAPEGLDSAAKCVSKADFMKMVGEREA